MRSSLKNTRRKNNSGRSLQTKNRRHKITKLTIKRIPARKKSILIVLNAIKNTWNEKSIDHKGERVI